MDLDGDEDHKEAERAALSVLQESTDDVSKKAQAARAQRKRTKLLAAQKLLNELERNDRPRRRNASRRLLEAIADSPG